MTRDTSRGTPSPARAGGAALAVASALFIAAATLSPTPGSTPTPGTVCLICGDYGGADFVLNVLLFVPLGLGLRVAGLSRWRAVLVGAAATLAIELLQLRVVVGRDASVGDLVSNTLGTLLGAEAAVRWRGALLPDARWARRLGWTAALAWLALGTATAWSVVVRGPDGGLLFRRSPPMRQWGWFPGRILGVRAGDAVIAPDAGGGDDRFYVLAQVAHGGPVRMDAAVVSGGPSPGTAAIALVWRPGAYAVAAVVQRRRDVVFHVRTAAALARVRVPGVAIEDLFAPRDERRARGGRPVAGDTIHVSGDYTPRRIRVDARWRGGHASRTARLHPFVGWSYLLPWSYHYGAWADVLSALWAGGLLAPAAYWTARATRAGVAGAGAAALAGVVAGALLVLPAAAGVGVPPAPVWGGVAAGLALGATLGRWSARWPAQPDRSSRVRR